MSLADKLAEVAENVPKVYAAGENHGIVLGREEASAEYDASLDEVNDSLESVLYGTSEGGKSYYDMFWDVFQDNGKRTDYNMAFASRSWNVDTFKPKYDLTISSGCNRMFYQFNYDARYPLVDLVELLEELGVKMIFGGSVGTFYGFLDSARISRVGVIDVSRLNNQSQSYGMFNNYNLVTIDKLIVCEENTLVNSFLNATRLKNIVIEGKLGNSINLQYSPLTKESITSVINALSSTASGQTCTFKKSAKEAAFTEDEWGALIDTKSNWTISLV